MRLFVIEHFIIIFRICIVLDIFSGSGTGSERLNDRWLWWRERRLWICYVRSVVSPQIAVSILQSPMLGTEELPLSYARVVFARLKAARSPWLATGRASSLRETDVVMVSVEEISKACVSII